jgi:putative ATP-binding cassette transporter
MSSDRMPALRGRALAAALLRLLRIYWRSPDAARGGALLLGAVALELATVGASVLVSDAQRRVVEGLDAREASSFLAAFAALACFALLSVAAATFRIYLRQRLEIRWRRGLTAEALGRWMVSSAYAERRLHGDEIDNPDQRVAEDVRDFVASALGLSLSLLAAVATLLAFGGLLWRLSSGWSLPLAGGLAIPGLLLWVALAFAIGSMIAAHLTGRRLVPINNDRLRVEADFRYGLMRFRDNVEPIVLSGGESAEHAGADARFQGVIQVFLRLIRAERNLNLLTGGLGQLSGLAPFLVAAPAYFAGALTLGMIVQARVAYDQVSGALLWFVNAYREIARWRANAERIDGFFAALEGTQREVAAGAPALDDSASGELRLEELRLRTPAGRTLVARSGLSIAPGARVGILGAAGSGKTILFRALAGIWPFGSGRIARPPRAHMLFLPQQPYFPIGTLRAAVSFPATEGSFPDTRIAEALASVGLGSLARQLGETAVWEERLSGQEQQRLGFARALLQGPAWLLLDQAASTLDEDSERRLYELVLSRLPHATVVALGPRARALELLTQRWRLSPEPDGSIALQAA